MVVFEARGVPGGLDTLGIAAYKISTEFALAEIERDPPDRHRRSSSAIASRATRCAGLLGSFDAVFLGIGLGRTAPLEIEGEDLEGVWEALDFIFQTHTRPFTECVVGNGRRGDRRRQHGDRRRRRPLRRLGAETVTIAYRRSEAVIPAFAYEYELAKADGIRFEWFAQPIRIVGDGSTRTGVEFVRTEPEDPGSRAGGVRTIPGSNFMLGADMVVKALGQEPLLDLLAALPDLKCDRGRIVVDRATGDNERSRALRRRRLPAKRRRGRRRGPGWQDRGATASTPLLSTGYRHDRSVDRILRRQGAESVLAGVRPADQFRVSGPSRLRRRLGRRGLEDARRTSRSSTSRRATAASTTTAER